MRPAGRGDIGFLREMLFEALYVHENEERFSRSVLDEPELHRYIAEFGARPGDIGVIAQVSDGPIGACWLRLFHREAPGYGWVADEVPELSVAVVEACRGLGVGTAMIEAALQLTADAGIGRVSLSVDPRSPALRLYQRLGFEVLGRSGTSLTMLRSADL